MCERANRRAICHTTDRVYVSQTMGERERNPYTSASTCQFVYALLKASPVSFVCSFELVFLAKIQFFVITSVYLIMN